MAVAVGWEMYGRGPSFVALDKRLEVLGVEATRVDAAGTVLATDRSREED